MSGRILIVGAGAMGQAVAGFLSAEIRSRILMIDCNTEQLRACTRHAVKTLVADVGSVQLETVLDERPTLVVACLPWAPTEMLALACARRGLNFISVTRPIYDHVHALDTAFKAGGAVGIYGAGVEPGLAELIGREVLATTPGAHALHLRCGGIPERPDNALGYRRLFGEELPFELRPTFEVVEGKLKSVERFSDVEHMIVPDVGELECWHDGLIPFVFGCAPFASLTTMTQKTIRWPGYARAVTTLHELGLLDHNEILLPSGGRATPWDITQTLLRPSTTLRHCDTDLLVLQAECHSEAGRRVKTLVDRASDGMTAMQRTTGATASLTAEILLNSERRSAGFASLDQALSASERTWLLEALERFDITITENAL